MPQFVTLDCIFTLVLPAPNTQPYHSWLLKNWGYMWGRQSSKTRPCLVLSKFVFEKTKSKKKTKTKSKTKKTRIIWEVVTPQRQDQVWSSPLAKLLLKLRTTGLLNLRIEWGNSISIQNWVICGVVTPKELTKPPCIKTTKKKKKYIFLQKRAHMTFCYWGHRL